MFKSDLNLNNIKFPILDNIYTYMIYVELANGDLCTFL